MGIRMLHRRTAPARRQAQAYAVQAPFSSRLPVPAHAAGASTARIPVNLVTQLRRRFARRDRDVVPEEPSVQRLWGELALSYLALALTLLPRSRPVPTMTVFVATADPVSGGPEGRPPAERPVSWPGATA